MYVCVFLVLICCVKDQEESTRKKNKNENEIKVNKKKPCTDDANINKVKHNNNEQTNVCKQLSSVFFLDR